INNVSGHAVIDEPVSRVKPAVAAKSPSFKSNREHIRKQFQQAQFFSNAVLFSLGQRDKQIPYGIRPDDLRPHFLFLLRARDIRRTSLWGVTRPSLMALSDSFII